MYGFLRFECLPFYRLLFCFFDLRGFCLVPVRSPLIRTFVTFFAIHDNLQADLELTIRFDRFIFFFVFTLIFACVEFRRGMAQFNEFFIFHKSALLFHAHLDMPLVNFVAHPREQCLILVYFWISFLRFLSPLRQASCILGVLGVLFYY